MCLSFKDTWLLFLQDGHRKYGNVIDVKIVLTKLETFTDIEKKKKAWGSFYIQVQASFFLPLNLFEPACAEAGISRSGRAEVVFMQITSSRVILVPNLELYCACVFPPTMIPSYDKFIDKYFFTYKIHRCECLFLAN